MQKKKSIAKQAVSFFIFNTKKICFPPEQQKNTFLSPLCSDQAFYYPHSVPYLLLEGRMSQCRGTPPPPPSSSSLFVAICYFPDQAFGGHPEGRRDDMLVEVDLRSIVADIEGGAGASVDGHVDGHVVASFGSQDPYDMVTFFFFFYCCVLVVLL